MKLFMESKIPSYISLDMSIPKGIYAWHGPDKGDPVGLDVGLGVVKLLISETPHIKKCFVEQSSLYQNPLKSTDTHLSLLPVEFTGSPFAQSK